MERWTPTRALSGRLSPRRAGRLRHRSWSCLSASALKGSRPESDGASEIHTSVRADRGIRRVAAPKEPLQRWNEPCRRPDPSMVMPRIRTSRTSASRSARARRWRLPAAAAPCAAPSAIGPSLIRCCIFPGRDRSREDDAPASLNSFWKRAAAWYRSLVDMTMPMHAAERIVADRASATILSPGSSARGSSTSTAATSALSGKSCELIMHPGRVVRLLALGSRHLLNSVMF